MKVTLEFITPDAENFIGKMAAICYDANTDPERNVKRAAKCAEDGHLATMRFAHAVFNIQGISRACSHQFVRSKHLDFLQRSQRYCKDNEAGFTIPNMTIEQRDEYFEAMSFAKATYSKLLNLGMRKEDARFVLPESTHTEVNVVGNLQAWQDFIKLRADKHAQWEIREVATQVNNILATHCPHLFKRIDNVD